MGFFSRSSLRCARVKCLWDFESPHPGSWEPTWETLTTTGPDIRTYVKSMTPVIREWTYHLRKWTGVQIQLYVYRRSRSYWFNNANFPLGVIADMCCVHTSYSMCNSDLTLAQLLLLLFCLSNSLNRVFLLDVNVSLSSFYAAKKSLYNVKWLHYCCVTVWNKVKL